MQILTGCLWATGSTPLQIVDGRIVTAVPYQFHIAFGHLDFLHLVC